MKRLLRFALFVVAAGAAGTAAADVPATRDFSAERFRWTFARTGILGAEWAQVPGHLSFDFGVWVGTANDPLIMYQVIDGRHTRVGSLVEQRTSANLVASLSLWGRFELGLDVPLILAQQEGDIGSFGMLDSISGVGFGDLRVAPKIALLDRGRNGLGISITPAVTLPTANGKNYRGDSSVMFAPELGISKRFGVVRAAVNVGYRMREEKQLANLTVDDEVFATAAAGVRVAEPVELQLGLSGATAANDIFGASNRNYLEANGGATFALGNTGLLLSAMVGTGLDQGFGAPDWRAVLGLRFGKINESSAPAHTRDGVPDLKKDEAGVPDPDTDGDGIPDALDKCPMEPETVNGFDDDDGCPDAGDRDADGIRDDVDQCPDEPEDFDHFEDEDGCPDLDNDKDGVTDVQDRCPNIAGPVENAGCPDTDRDGDTVVDRLDNCPDQKGPPKFHGCPDKQLVVITSQKLEILDVVYFALDKAVIQSRSNRLLDQVANVLKAHPEISNLSIEGHTDDQGKPAYNKDLSQRRADAVMAYLVKRGVDAGRLQAIGYGQDQPIADNVTKVGRAKNRRVEFKIVGAPWVQVQPTGPGADTIEK
jgi:outer membrane protein OmpA-like peptidoglycan-associated protein